jgi:DNA-binding XRE family transcriptional regulator
MMSERPSFSCARQTNGGVLRINLVIMAMTNVVSGRQIRAGRALAGLTQAELARAAGCHPRSVRYWEAKDTNPPTNVVSTLDSIEQALIRHGVVPFAIPKPGVRLL